MGDPRVEKFDSTMSKLLSLSKVAERVTLRAQQLAKMGDLLRQNLISKKPAVAPRGPVVSLTSFGVRARTVAFTLESIASGELRPSRLMLWLDEEALLRSPPDMLKRLRERGVELCPTENFGPHKKYYPFVTSQSEFELPLVTADDDVVYPRTWLSGLMDRYHADASSVHCYRARVVAMAGSGFEPYANWAECNSDAPSHRHFSIGMAGVLLPPPVLQSLKRAGAEFRDSCPRTDDIWLNLHAQRVGAKVRQVHPIPDYFMLLPGTQKVGLLHSNVGGGNDDALRAVYTPADLARLESAS
jgi:hypothetical protein